MRLEVKGNRVLLKEVTQRQEKTSSQIIVPGTAKMDEITGTNNYISTAKVINTGKDCSCIEKDDLVLFVVQDAAPIVFQEENYFIIREAQIILSFKEKEVKKLVHDRVMVDVDTQEKITKSGLIIPDVVKHPTTTGVIEEVGSTVKSLEKGDHIIYGTSAGTEISLFDKSFMIVREPDVVAKID